MGLLTSSERVEIEKKQIDKKDLIVIPRRPKWDEKTSAEELQTKEKENFLAWRRDLAMLQEEDGLMLTPYEKNLEFWRQLWRVVERSDVVAQIVDARNPLQYRSEDLEKYVKEMGEDKMNMILVNKADFLNDEQRAKWAEYFDTLNMKVAFFSATLAVEEFKAMMALKEENENSDDEIENSDDESDDEPINLDEIKKATNELEKSIEKTENQLEILEEKITELPKEEPIWDESKNNPKVLTRDELMNLFKRLHTGPKVTEGLTTIGLVGYPNVGKSSTINALMTVKKVSVSATPGKTKHFQTLFLDNDLLLCDCPGLVMPSFVSTKADMILNGILPIDQMRDHVPPVNLVCNIMPRYVLEDLYGIMIVKPIEGEDPTRSPHAEELLLAFGYNRGFMTANGQPDQSRSARFVLKDYVNGKLLYAYAPPGYSQEEFLKFPERSKESIDGRDMTPREQRAIKIGNYTSSSQLDKGFFIDKSNTAYVKGRMEFPHIRPGSSLAGSTQSLVGVENAEKPWRVRQKKEKKEKLRRKFVHLDQH